jgi:acetyl-CoA acyltransferase
MGITAENVATRWKREPRGPGQFAFNSHQKAIAAIAAGEFKDEILPFTLDDRYPNLAKQETKADGRRSTTTRARAPTPRPRRSASCARVQDGRQRDRGQQSQMSDGAAAVLLASERAVKEYGLKPLARFVSFSVAGVPPDIMGIGPIAAIPKALAQAGITKEQLDWIELNEAFAAQALAVIRDVGLDPAKVNPLGGAIALGHPLGATGAVRTATIAHGMRRQGHKYGMVTMCIGTGMGAAGVFEAL